MINRSCSLGLLSLSLLISACGGGGGQASDFSKPSSTSADTAISADTATSADTVTAAKVGTVTLDWSAPASRSDGDPLSLSEIASYTVYFGTSSGDYPYSVAINDPSATTVDIPDLPPDTYYLVMTTTDTQGRESGYSGVAVKEVS